MSAPAPFPKRFRVKYTRSRDGCLPCRARRKQCNLEKPTCGACKQRCVTCYWPQGQSPPVASLPTSDDTPPAELAADGADNDPSFDSPGPQEALRYYGAAIQQASGISGHLFHYYKAETLELFTTRPLELSACSQVLCIAATDDVVMHAVLALSGTHFNSNTRGTLPSRQATSGHYCSALKGIRNSIRRLNNNCRREWLRLGLALSLVAQVESISGTLTGAIFIHLRALREVIVKLLAMEAIVRDSAEEQMECLIYETYAFLATISNIVPYGAMPDRQLPLDPFITNLDYLRSYISYGDLFGCSRAVFELILPTSVVARSIMLDLHSSPDVSEPTATRYYYLLGHISNLQLPSSDEVIDPQFSQSQSAACELYRHALLAWLKSAYANFTVQPDGHVHPQIQSHLDPLQPLFVSSMSSPYKQILLWPTMILGSCMVRPKDIAQLRNWLMLADAALHLDLISASIHLLNTLWATPFRLCGPCGLLQVMQEHGISLCVG